MSTETPAVADHADNAAEGGMRSKRLALVGAVVAFCVAVDLWSKQWAWNHLRDVDGVDPEVARRGIPVIDHVFYLKFGFNTGSAFSFLHDASWARAFFIAISFVALVYMGWLAWKMPTRHRYGFIAIGMIAGGTIGNLHDRFFRTMEMWVDGRIVERHGVIDFLQFFWDWEGQRYWPIFNAADSSLVCGVALLLIYIRVHGRREEEAAAPIKGSSAVEVKSMGGDERLEAAP